ncbi:MAG: hypothetical protein IT328_16235 [Caldilineaceae bacterium]|nr:hypothetical protein [Caldilineaceae bacterium]
MTDEEIARSAPRVAPVASWWSVERLLYALMLALGLSIRLWALGAQPLSPWEASNSWPAWLAANGLRVVDAPTPNSALFYGLQWLLFWTGINSDGGARFFSAIAGALLIVLPWWWRGLLGRRVALLVACLLAIDPWLLGFSRLADGASVALLGGLLVLTGMSKAAGQQTKHWPRITAVAAGLLLVSGPMGWNFLPIVILWGWLLRSELAAAGMWQRPWLLWFGGAAWAGATVWFARLDGLAWIGSGVSVWLSQFDGRSAGPLLPLLTGGYDLAWPWLRLWVDAALLLPLGAGGLAVLAYRTQRAESGQPFLRRLFYLCAGWLLWGALLWLLPGRSPLALPMVGLPLLLLSAFGLDALIDRYPRDLDWREAGAVVLTLLILMVSGTLWLTALLANRTYDPVLAQATLVIFGLGIAILVAFAVWANRSDAAWVAAALLASLLLVIYVRSSWKLSFANVVIEPAGWQATMAHPEVQLLARDMETLSSHRAGDPHELPVQVQVASYVTGDDQVVPARPDPVLGWELRNMRNLAWVTAPLVEADSVPLPLVVTPATASDDPAQLDLPSTYAGSRYHVDRWWLPRTLVQDDTRATEDESSLIQRWAMRVQPWWRWMVYREATEAPRNRDVILWASLETAVK